LTETDVLVMVICHYPT